MVEFLHIAYTQQRATLLKLSITPQNKRTSYAVNILRA